MNDTDLTAAYERLADAAGPPPDATDRIAARVTQRRRRRATGLCVAAVLLIAGAGGVATAIPDSPDGPARDPAAPTPSTLPSADLQLTCTTGAARSGTVDAYRGAATLTELLQAARSRGRYVVDLEGQRVLSLREDGTVHTEQTWFTGGGEWFQDTTSSCSDWIETVDRDIARDAHPLALEVGHCWIAPVEFEGEVWDVMAEDQFGWGGGAPRGFASTGEAWRAGDVVSYRDDSGTLLTLVPADGPWISRRGLCD